MSIAADLLRRLAGDNPPKIIGNAPHGADAQLLAANARQHGVIHRPKALHICLDDARLSQLKDQLAFFAPDIDVVTLPAWDCLPYDRVSPNADLSAMRVATLARLALQTPDKPQLILTTLNAATQRIVPKAWLSETCLTLKRGDAMAMEALAIFLAERGYLRATTVNEAGDFAVRGGLLDVWPSGADAPLRLDFFGDELDTIRAFDPASQRTSHAVDALEIIPANELDFSPAAVKRFRMAYVEHFGAVIDDDPIYQAASEARRAPGIDHWMPLFFSTLETVFDLIADDAVLTIEQAASEAANDRFTAITDYYEARNSALEAEGQLSAPYKPLPPEALYLGEAEWSQRL
ncbi:MAG: transcription-repair coupling factor, partial [Pseudomonadota bacterium]